MSGIFLVFRLPKCYLEEVSSTTNNSLLSVIAWHQVVKNQFFEYLAYDSKKGYDIYDFIFGLVAVTVRNTSFSLSVNCHEADKRSLLMPIPTLVIGSLTAWLKIFVCFRGSVKRGLSGSENKHFSAKWSLYGFFAKKYCHFYSSYGSLAMISLQHFLHTSFSKLYILDVRSFFFFFSPFTSSCKKRLLTSKRENYNLWKAFTGCILLPFWKGGQSEKPPH